MEELEKLIVDTDHARNKVTIYYRERQGDRLVYIGYGKDGLIQKVIDSNEPTTEELPKLLELPISMYNNLLGMFANAAREKGIATKRGDFIEGELQATKLHLKDLQEQSDMIKKAWDLLLTRH